MQKLVSYISRFLLMILLFPMLLQGVHMVIHHHDSTSYLHSVESELNKSLQSQICLICEFEFASFDMVSSHCILATFQFGDCYIQSLNFYLPNLYNGFNFNLRAPPVIY